MVHFIPRPKEVSLFLQKKKVWDQTNRFCWEWTHNWNEIKRNKSKFLHGQRIQQNSMSWKCFLQYFKFVIKILAYHNNALICLGDWNVNLLSNSKSKLQDINYKIIKEYDLTDIGNIFENSPTWRGKGNRVNSISRLDLVLTILTRKILNLT